MKKLGSIVAVLMILLAGTKPVFAHQRNYVWTEEYKTLPRNSFEIEGSTTLQVPRGNRSAENSWQYRGEVEYGITDHWNIAHYESWQTENQAGVDENGAPNKDVTKYQGFKFETKYRIGEQGKYWLDPLIYLEWSTDPLERENPNAIEAKIVLSKTIKKFNITYNQIMESRLGSGGRTEQEYSAAASYELLSGVYVGTEFTGQYWAPGGGQREIAMGPTVAWENRFFWVAMGTLFGMNDITDDYQARVIVGVSF